MGTLSTIDSTTAARRADDGSRYGDFASELDLPTWEEFTDARERFFARLASAPMPRGAVRRIGDGAPAAGAR